MLCFASVLEVWIHTYMMLFSSYFHPFLLFCLFPCLNPQHSCLIWSPSFEPQLSDSSAEICGTLSCLTEGQGGMVGWYHSNEFSVRFGSSRITFFQNFTQVFKPIWPNRSDQVLFGFLFLFFYSRERERVSPHWIVRLSWEKKKRLCLGCFLCACLWGSVGAGVTVGFCLLFIFFLSLSLFYSFV